MEVLRAVYVVAEDTEYGEWVRGLWEDRLPADDPLWCLLRPDDLRGEVTAWGEWPHWTCLDALTVTDSEAFDDIVKEVCAACEAPTIEPKELRIFGRALEVKCASEGLQRINNKLMAKTHQLLARGPLTDEEFQRGRWWIEKGAVRVGDNLEALDDARETYRHAGSPPLPRSRHFRLGFLMRLWKRLQEKGDTRATKRLVYFLAHGEPPLYAKGGSPHTTTASGLNVGDDEDRARQLDEFRKLLWPNIEEKLHEFRPSHLAIMGEDPDNPVTVHFFDWLTETFVEETRPGVNVVDKAPFAGT